jgi:hypothetical protein
MFERYATFITQGQGILNPQVYKTHGHILTSGVMSVRFEVSVAVISKSAIF